jgi:hypothetical protein
MIGTAGAGEAPAAHIGAHGHPRRKRSRLIQSQSMRAQSAKMAIATHSSGCMAEVSGCRGRPYTTDRLGLAELKARQRFALRSTHNIIGQAPAKPDSASSCG